MSDIQLLTNEEAAILVAARTALWRISRKALNAGLAFECTNRVVIGNRRVIEIRCEDAISAITTALITMQVYGDKESSKVAANVR